MASNLLSAHDPAGYYDARKSSSAVQTAGQSFNLGYASGSVYGNVWADTVTVGNEGDGGALIKVGGNPIECAQNVGGSLPQLPAVDGKSTT